jgi:hypothetical protein
VLQCSARPTYGGLFFGGGRGGHCVYANSNDQEVFDYTDSRALKLSLVLNRMNEVASMLHTISRFLSWMNERCTHIW